MDAVACVEIVILAGCIASRAHLCDYRVILFVADRHCEMVVRLLYVFRLLDHDVVIDWAVEQREKECKIRPMKYLLLQAIAQDSS